MAQNVVIKNVRYDSVPQVEIPKQDGGTAVFVDASGTNVTAGDLRNGKKAMGPDGEVTGNLAEIAAATTEITAKAQVVTIAAGIHSGSGKVQLSAADQAALVAGNIKSGVTVLGVAGGLVAASITQDSSTKVLSIS